MATTGNAYFQFALMRRRELKYLKTEATDGGVQFALARERESECSCIPVPAFDARSPPREAADGNCVGGAQSRVRRYARCGRACSRARAAQGTKLRACAGQNADNARAARTLFVSGAWAERARGAGGTRTKVGAVGTRGAGGSRPRGTGGAPANTRADGKDHAGARPSAIGSPTSFITF